MKTMILLIGVLCLLQAVVPAMATTNHYTCPPNLALELVALPSQDPGVLRLCASVESLVGTPTQLDLFFESSADLVVAPAKEQLNVLEKGRKQEFILSVKPTGKAADLGGTWVRLRVVYLPSYKDIIAIIGNEKDFPDQAERQRLLRRVLENQKKKARQTDATRYFPQNFPAKPR